MVPAMRQRLSNDHGDLETDACGAIPLPEALRQDHEVGPYRLRTGVAAPDAPGDRGDHE